MDLRILKKKLREQCKKLGITGKIKRHPSERTIIIETDGGTILFYPVSLDKDCNYYKMRCEKVLDKEKMVEHLFKFYKNFWDIKGIRNYHIWEEFERKIRIKYIKLRDW